MTEQEFEAIKLKGMASAVDAVEAFTAKVRECKHLERADIMSAMVRALSENLPEPPSFPGGKHLVAIGLLAAAIALLAEERNKREAKEKE